ncbi:hypothetical protein Fmac_026378 [Flemingia macrophylla]|uniref:Uncharacterized protein n=1 Tax=Flemingia macrophylla TaxID=520843 RepID=A0ABD1LEQ3_9FABA
MTDLTIEFPFEICALEVLEAICSFLDARTRELETPGYLALDELTSKVCDSYSHIVSWASGILLKLVGLLSHLDIANKNAANRAKLVIPHILGSKTLARKRDELETIHGREFSRAEMYQLSHKKPNGTFVNEEARELHEKLQEEMQHCSENEALLRVCGKEHPGYVRGMGLGVSPSQIIGSSSGATSSSTSFESNERIEQMQAEIQSLKAQVAEIDSLKAHVAEVDVLKQHIAFLMQHAKGDETPDLESPVNKRSSEGSHMPEGGNSPATI